MQITFIDCGVLRTDEGSFLHSLLELAALTHLNSKDKQTRFIALCEKRMFEYYPNNGNVSFGGDVVLNVKF